jgi:hypothetical protein
MCHTGLTSKMKRSGEIFFKIIGLPVIWAARITRVGRDIPRVRRSGRSVVSTGSGAVWR